MSQSLGIMQDKVAGESGPEHIECWIGYSAKAVIESPSVQNWLRRGFAGAFAGSTLAQGANCNAEATARKLGGTAKAEFLKL